MSLIRGQFYENIFQTHYEYLQIAYFNQNELKNACRAAASYILLNSASKEMQENIEFYKKQPGVDVATYFTPRSVSKGALSQGPKSTSEFDIKKKNKPSQYKRQNENCDSDGW